MLGKARRRVEGRVADARARRRHREIAAAPPAAGRIAVSYGVERLPGLDEGTHGGIVKFQELARVFPNEPRSFNVLYLGSSTRPPDSSRLLAAARARGAAVVVNQNGVAYPAWHGPGWERTNEPLAELLHAADHVVFQSEFCKLSSDRFLGERQGAFEVLPNPVDTERFVPRERPPGPPVLLLAGTHTRRYRLEVAVETLELVRREVPEARLVVAGSPAWLPDRRAALREAEALAARSGVELLGAYSQAAAPALFARADVLVHPQYNDACPTLVLEAMACGVPVAYSSSGGTPELVGPDAGIGVPAPLDWEREHPPDPKALGDAVLRILDRRDELAEAARARALRFEVRRWIERHRELFEELVG